ncbi:MAG: hypothetical protein WCW54_02510 [Candidatus Paceibacterota bacterium]
MQTEKSFKHVTNRQGVQLAHRANENGVSREDWVKFTNDSVKLAKFFDEMKNGDNWFEKLQVEAQKIGARVSLLKLKVDYTKSHNESAMAGGPQTDSSYNVLKVGDKYQPSENKVVEEVIVLLNYPQGGGNYQKTVEWGISNGLSKTTPHVPFAIGEQFSKLNYTLGPNPMYVVETTGCSFGGSARACFVYWYDAERWSDLSWQGIFGNDDDWFAFRKK